MEMDEKQEKIKLEELNEIFQEKTSLLNEENKRKDELGKIL